MNCLIQRKSAKVYDTGRVTLMTTLTCTSAQARASNASDVVTDAVHDYKLYPLGLQVSPRIFSFPKMLSVTLEIHTSTCANDVERLSRLLPGMNIDFCFNSGDSDI